MIDTRLIIILKKLGLLTFLGVLWQIFVEVYIDDFITVAKFFLAVTIYKIFPYSFWELLTQSIIVFASWKFYRWISGGEETKLDHKSM